MAARKIAMFALEVFLLPGEKAELHISEDKYQQLLNDCVSTGKPFGIPFFDKGKITPYGSLVQIETVQNHLQDGSSDILLEAVGNFQLSSFVPKLSDKPYPGGYIKMLKEQEPLFPDKELSRIFRSCLQEQLGQEIDINVEEISLTEIAIALQLDNQKKIHFIQLNDFRKQLKFLKEQVQFISLLIRQNPSVVNNIFLN